ncbi:MAG: cytochrome b/b6 domain-containing protein, partial [Albidovulum sp.]|uniref:cytochrome b n=1 Tax=Albidovulum sp. TaxID=1872424 RepID=UPI003CABDB3E
ETFLAQMTHWCLWIGILALPLTGLLHHSAAPGFAPILWPFGQTLPLVPADEALALMFRRFHEMSGWLLMAALALHVAGTLKHVLIDRDATLGRMITGNAPPAPSGPQPRLGIAAALSIWFAIVLVALLTAPAPEADPFDDLPEELFPLD